MNLQFTSRELLFRDEVRDFLLSSVPRDISRKLRNDHRLSKDDIVRWQQILNAKGWAVPHWPVEWGGTRWTSVERYIFREEMQAFPAPPPLDFAVDMIGPLLIARGSDEQKRRFLPRIANLDDWWCQGFSEPGAGSDLAALKTSARRDGNKYVLNGQKIWTTMAHYADWMFCLARTAHGEKKQSGISFLLVNMKSAGITVRPIITMEGDHEVNEVFFDDVQVPAENLVGEQDRGWDCAKFLLSNERTTIARVGVSKARIRRIKELAASEHRRGQPMIEDRRFRERLAALEVELKALEMTQLRFLAGEEIDGRTGASDATASLLKIKGAEIQQATTELLLELAGPFATPFAGDEQQMTDDDGGRGLFVSPEWATRAAPTYFHWRKMSIYGGSDEIQRNILARGIFGG
ncbi:Pimeloyl-CoA dehydrogenase (Large subunit) [Bradyrhizobium sp. ORS 375]|uniref:acyl-CoA dehydrogenase family protein n=1 Tax=Bradyrhizobium sp. (strain ORS 375) TaxID=566679 RepID=UPI0002407013|nr:acyl-CoA dehydrogenase family protein [Bradyrhizobium sp. ORS 375]CCD96743.1 Pimeloyl-CoA dehydrogenase (Large subunit) [Bradyrhizobium sp. ORS 375]